MVFPESNFCCKSCNATQGCGAVKPNWLDGAEYLGQQIIDGEACDGWVQQGNDRNFMWFVAGTNTPVSFYEGTPTLEQGINLWNFTTYHAVQPPSSVFVPPAYCAGAPSCPLFR